MDKKMIPPSELPRFYDRGDLPVKMGYNKGIPQIIFLIDAVKLDYKFYLPLFFDGLREKAEPYRMIALLGTIELLEKGGLKVVETLP